MEEKKLKEQLEYLNRMELALDKEILKLGIEKINACVAENEKLEETIDSELHQLKWQKEQTNNINNTIEELIDEIKDPNSLERKTKKETKVWILHNFHLVEGDIRYWEEQLESFIKENKGTPEDFNWIKNTEFNINNKKKDIEMWRWLAKGLDIEIYE